MTTNKLHFHAYDIICSCSSEPKSKLLKLLALDIKVSVPALMRLGALRFQQNRVLDADELYKRAQLMDPTNLQIPVEQSVVLSKMGKNKDALNLLNSARMERDLSCTHPELHLNLAKLYANEKRHIVGSSLLETCVRNAKQKMF